MKESIENVVSTISDNLCDFFSLMDNDRVIVFDTETGGLETTSPVLSISAILLKINKNKEMFEVDRYNRFYYPNPSKYCHPKAIEVNGITNDKIEELRGRSPYPDYFEDDIKSFYEWCSGCIAFIGHNVQFDLKYVPDLVYTTIFDTMLTNINYVQSEWNDYRNSWKWPKLIETCAKYSIKVKEGRLHESIYDVELTAEVFKCMLKEFPFRMKRLREYEVI